VLTAAVGVVDRAKGAAKSQLAGAMMREEGLGDIDVVYTSVLSRSIKSAWAVLEELDRM
jgi:bisphosphoglycerate-dependent phosphoglycerate mutase